MSVNKKKFKTVVLRKPLQGFLGEKRKIMELQTSLSFKSNSFHSGPRVLPLPKMVSLDFIYVHCILPESKMY